MSDLDLDAIEARAAAAAPVVTPGGGRVMGRCCDTCRDTGLIPWMVECDPNLYQDPDADGMLPCPDCGGDA